MRSTVIMLLISCLTVMGCYNPDWSDKDADFLITQLKNNRHYQLREKAAYLLASKVKQERDKVIPALTHALLDEYAYVREAAAEVLGSIEPPAVSAIPAPMEALQREDTVFSGVLAALHSDETQRAEALTAAQNRFDGLLDLAVWNAMRTSESGGDTEKAQEYLSILEDRGSDLIEPVGTTNGGNGGNGGGSPPIPE